jgi:hypothetical protein
MHILGSPDFSALEPEMPAVFGHLPHHFYVGLMGEHIDEKSGLERKFATMRGRRKVMTLSYLFNSGGHRIFVGTRSGILLAPSVKSRTFALLHS